MSTTICFTLPHPALHNDILRPLRRIPSFNLSPCLFGELQQFSVTTNTNTAPEDRTRMTKRRLFSRREVIVVLLDKFGLCWISLLPWLVRVGSNCWGSHISTTDLPRAAFPSFPSWFHTTYYLPWHCDVCWMSFKFPLYSNLSAGKTLSQFQQLLLVAAMKLDSRKRWWSRRRVTKDEIYWETSRSLLNLKMCGGPVAWNVSLFFLSYFSNVFFIV